jgi:hypothetical protein
MTIDKSGEWWKGSDSKDVFEYLGLLEPGGYPVNKAIEAKCTCGSSKFSVQVDRDEELAKTICIGCGRQTFVSDSADHWSNESPEQIECTCGSTAYEVSLGLFVKEEGWVRWMSIGLRCSKCGTLGSPLDWKSDAYLDDAAVIRIAG